MDQGKPAKPNQAVSLLVVMLWIFLLMSFLAGAGQVYIMARQASKNRHLAWQSFYLAEAGLAKAKWLLINDPAFSHTDLPYSGPAAGRKVWLCLGPEAGGPVGLVFVLADGGYKVIKERNINMIYSVGFVGSSPVNNSSLCLLKLNYQLDTATYPPIFRVVDWARIY